MSIVENLKQYDTPAEFTELRHYDCPLYNARFYFRHATGNDDAVSQNEKNFKTPTHRMIATYAVLNVDKDGRQIVNGIPRLKADVDALMKNPAFRKHCHDALKHIGEIGMADPDDETIVDADQEGTLEAAKKPSSQKPDENI